MTLRLEAYPATEGECFAGIGRIWDLLGELYAFTQSNDGTVHRGRTGMQLRLLMLPYGRGRTSLRAPTQPTRTGHNYL